MGEIIVRQDPVLVGLVHNDIPIDQVDDGYGGLADVYEITDIHYINETGTPWEFVAEPEIGEVTSVNIPAVEEKVINLPPNKYFRHYPATFHLSNRRPTI